MRSAMTRPTKYQNARKAYIDRSVSKLSFVKPRLKLGVGTPGKPFSPPVKCGQGIELDEEEHLCDRHGDHGEINAGAPERDQTDQIADNACNQTADHNRR